MDELIERWNFLYKEFLPSLAKAKDPVQSKWPVQLDHCFARIVLDNAIGKDRPWTEVLKSPAYKNMSEAQLNEAIAMAERIAGGQDPDLLVELDDKSLQLRNKKLKTKSNPNKRSADEDLQTTEDGPSPPKKTRQSAPPTNLTISKYFLPSPPTSSKPTSSKASTSEAKPPLPSDPPSPKMDTTSYPSTLDPTHYHPLILSSHQLTPFRKLSLLLLTQIPPGHYSTYAALSTFISSTYHKTCARAIGSAMKNNPFAPGVPCHRVIAADGTIGGFKGGWGEEGTYAKLKRELLREEGVGFDSRGRVKGPVWTGFERVEVEGL